MGHSEIDVDPAKLGRFEPCPTTGCFIWSGHIDQYGYGSLWSRGSKRVIRAHRALWYVLHGEIPSGRMVCHRCDNRFCVNPDHLYLGTHADNMRDMFNRGRNSAPPVFSGRAHHLGAKTHCPRGHEYSPENTYFFKGRGGRQCKTCVKARAAAVKRFKRQQVPGQ